MHMYPKRQKDVPNVKDKGKSVGQLVVNLEKILVVLVVEKVGFNFNTNYFQLN